MSVKNIVAKFVKLAEKKVDESTWPVCLGPDEMVEKLSDWLGQKYVNLITQECEFVIQDFIFTFTIRHGKEEYQYKYSIDGTANGQKEEYLFDYKLTKEEFMHEFESMLNHYKGTKIPFQMCIDGDGFDVSLKKVQNIIKVLKED